MITRNNISQLVTSTGVGNIGLGAPISGLIALNDVAISGEKLYYTLTEGSNIEIGYGTYISAGNYIERTKVFETVIDGVLDNSGTEYSVIGGLNATISLAMSYQSLISHPSVFHKVSANFHDIAASPATTALLVGGIPIRTFPDSGTSKVGFSFLLPLNVEPSSVKELNLLWAPMTANTGSTKWEIEVASAVPNSSNFSGVTELTALSAGSGTANQLQEVVIPFAGTTMGANNWIVGAISRDHAHASDTFTGDAGLIGLALTYKSAMVGSPIATAPYDWS